MRAINDAFEGADAFRKMLDGITDDPSADKPEALCRYVTAGTRAERRAAERAMKAEQKRERKARQRAALEGAKT